MFVPGSIFATNKVNAHRQNWDGTICKGAQGWSCGADQNFRTDYCMSGESKCFHINLFNPEKPSYKLHSKVGDDFLVANPHILEDQIIAFWGKSFSEPGGITIARGSGAIIYGLYRIKKIERVTLPNEHNSSWIITPHDKEWTRLPLNSKAPYFTELEGSRFLHNCKSETLQRTLEDNRNAFDPIPRLGWTETDALNFKKFCENLPEWMEIATSKSEKYPIKRTATLNSDVHPNFAMAEGLSKIISVKKIENIESNFLQSKSVSTNVVNETKSNIGNSVKKEEFDIAPINSISEITQRTSFPEVSMCEQLEEEYGTHVVRQIRFASLTKKLIVLSGSPGTGKSRLALNFVDDISRERTIIIPVASTWKGREDLLGYVNPINGHFEPTAFTQFLYRSEKAWDSGIKLPYIVIFEEFNLSQPEHWFSDVLVRCEYPMQSRKDRTIDLGGQSVAGFPDLSPSIFLSPNLFFVATVNSDHTTRALSPRVLDRASLIEISIEPRVALKRARVELAESQIIAIERLNEAIQSKGISFSIRSALSLKMLIDQLPFLDAKIEHIIDTILLQEVLSKIRLFADDPHDSDIMSNLKEWGDSDVVSDFPLCTRQILRWSENIDLGLDISQA